MPANDDVGEQAEEHRTEQLSLEFFAFITAAMASMQRDWEQRKAEITAQWPHDPPS